MYLNILRTVRDNCILRGDIADIISSYTRYIGFIPYGKVYFSWERFHYRKVRILV